MEKKHAEANPYGLLSGYNSQPTLEENLRDLEQESGIIRDSFPSLASARYDRSLFDKIQSGKVVLPPGAERWVLIPCWFKLAPSNKYREAVLSILDRLERHGKRSVLNGRTDRLAITHLRPSLAIIKAMRIIRARQGNHDLLIIPVQLGWRYKEFSVRQARKTMDWVMQRREFGLSTVVIGSIILTHPELLCLDQDLYIDCAGDEFSPGGDGEFCEAPYFSVYDGKMYFSTSDIDEVSDHWGAASGFLF